MHFRVRKNVIQLIRIVYDPEKKKGVTSVVGSVRLDAPQLTPELRGVMTAEEISAFDVWLDLHHRAELLREELAALTLAETMAKAQRWFEREGATAPARSTATDLVAQWHALRKVMVKSGLLD